MEQVENFEENSDMNTSSTNIYQYKPANATLKVAEESIYYGPKRDGK